MASDALDRLRAASEKKNESTAFRADYEACKAVLSEEGRSAADLAELADVLKIDLEEGPGIERPFPMSLDERRECWRHWFQSWTGCGKSKSSGVK